MIVMAASFLLSILFHEVELTCSRHKSVVQSIDDEIRWGYYGENINCRR